MRRPITTALVAAPLALAAAVPAAASVDPSIMATPRTVHRGHELLVRGTSWVVGAGCARHVTVTVRRGSTRILLGRPRVPSHTGAIRVVWTVPRDIERGRWRLVGRQACDQGGPMVRSARVTIR